MSDFKAKTHQIVCRLGLLGPPSWILGGLLLRREGREGKGDEGRVGKGKGMGEEGKGDGRAGEE